MTKFALILKYLQKQKKLQNCSSPICTLVYKLIFENQAIKLKLIEFLLLFKDLCVCVFF